MVEITTEVIIQTSPQKVWDVLTDFSAYPQWNPFILNIEGMPQQGEILKAFIRPEGSKGMVFRPKVLVASPGVEFRWLGSVWIRGLFDGEHYFKLKSLPDGSTQFIHGERFTGILVNLFLSSLEEGTRNSFAAMNQALKERCEA